MDYVPRYLAVGDWACCLYFVQGEVGGEVFSPVARKPRLLPLPIADKSEYHWRHSAHCLGNRSIPFSLSCQAEVAKTLVIDKQEETRVPFLRGILTRSLRDAGLTFDEAYSLASSMRDELAGHTKITTDELRAGIVKRLRKEYDADIVQRYEVPPVTLPTIMVKDQEGNESPFSRGQHRRYLESSGLSADKAADITEKIHESLLQSRRQDINSSQLAHLTFDLLQKDVGKKAARHYVVWADFQRSGRPLLLLIGGTIGTGKSTIAAELSHRLDIVRTQSTDMLREVMRMMIPKRLVPVLHASSFKAWRMLPFVEDDELTDQLLTEGYQSQAELLAVASEAVIKRALGERVSVILEGVHVQPTFLSHIPNDNDAIVIGIMLAVLSPRELRKRIRGRSSQAVQRRATRYLEHFDSIWKLQSFLLSEADHYDIPIVANDKKGKASQQVLAAINRELSRQFSSSPERVFGPYQEI